MSLVDEERLLNTSAALDTRRRQKKKLRGNAVQDSDDKEVESLFKDTESDSVNDQLESLKRQLGEDGKGGKKRKTRDVNLDDLMQASVDTDIRDLKDKKTKEKGNKLFEQSLSDKLGVAQCDFSKAQIFNDCKLVGLDSDETPNKQPLPPQHEPNLSLALEDLSAIVSEAAEKTMQGAENINAALQVTDTASEDERNLAGLNRQLMPNFVVNIGDRQIKMPRLDLERVAGLFEDQ